LGSPRAVAQADLATAPNHKANHAVRKACDQPATIQSLQSTRVAAEWERENGSSSVVQDLVIGPSGEALLAAMRTLQAALAVFAEVLEAVCASPVDGGPVRSTVVVDEDGRRSTGSR
jgi:predicted ATPase